VTSDSDEILAFAAQFKTVVCFDRGSDLATDDVTLDPVVYDAVSRWEVLRNSAANVVVTLQPTSPLLTMQTLTSALSEFLESTYDSMISVVNRPHLSWKHDENGYSPNYRERLNRQLLPANLVETGAFLISRGSIVTRSTRLGKSVTCWEVSDDESTDIDSFDDWIVCDAHLSRKTIVFRVDGYPELGLGHIYRALTLAYALAEHDVCFLTLSRHQLGGEMLRAAHMNVFEVKNDAEVIDWLAIHRPDIYIHDCLDTDAEYILSVKALVDRAITFEDLGPGAAHADAVINAMYEENDSVAPNLFVGKEYVCLRDEFLTAQPREFSPVVNNVLVLFGGTDPGNLSQRIYQLATRANAKHVQFHFDFIVGPGYSHAPLEDRPEHGISVHKDVKRVSSMMESADLAFTSQGRTTFELASLGIPSIVLAQNERETLHRFAQMDNGFINLGLASQVSDADIASTFKWLVGASSIRAEMRRLMLKNDLKAGIKRVKRIILGDLV
jgi:spore coat polysaccharide biosynthesis predicted glycosyltransferase SpsG/CMP-N-acetylneuraminic acid synthetase